MSLLRWFGWLVLTGLTTVTRPAAAEEVALEYRAPSTCPDLASFAARLADRGGRLQGPRAAARAASLAVVVEPEATGFSGSLRIVTPQGESHQRVVHDPDCGEVVKGLAVIAAIALGANDTSAAEPATAAPTAETSPSPTESPPPTAAASSSADAAPQQLRGSSFGLPAATPVQAGTLRFVNDRRYGLAAGVDYGLLPKLWLPRYDFSATVTSFLATPGGATRITGPILQVRWSVWGPGTFDRDDLSLQVFGLGASVASCSALSYDTRAWTLLACGEFGVGWLGTKTRSRDGTFEKEGGGGFGTAGLSFSAERHLGDLFYLGLRLGGRVQLGGRQGDRPDGGSVVDMPIAAAFGALSFGVHF